MNNWIHAKIGENQIDNHNYWIGLVAKTKVHFLRFDTFWLIFIL